MSAISLDYGAAASSMREDVEMADAGPSTAPLQRANTSFFDAKSPTDELAPAEFAPAVPSPAECVLAGLFLSPGAPFLGEP